MNTHTTLTVVRPPATVAMILGTSPTRSPKPAKPVAAAPRQTQFAPPPPDDLRKFRDDIRRRYETPLQASWPQEGMNGDVGLQPHGRRWYQILVVDDEPGVCKAIRLLLEFDGHQVQTVASGEAALALLEQRPPFDLIITDYSMWGMKGDQLAARIKHRWPKQPIIMATSSADEFNIYGRPSGGVDCVINKPFSRKDLREAMDRVLR